MARGYWGRVDDYARELRVRAQLAQALALLEGSLAERVERRIQDADVRFVEVTREGRDFDRHVRHDSSWWWSRVPLKLGRLRYELEP